MENKTAELYAFIDKMDSELGDVWTSDRDCLANVLDTYASLQCAEMKEEIDELRKSTHLLHQAMTSAEMRGVEKGKAEMKAENERLKVNELNANSQIEQLQEEVERLRGLIRKVQNNGIHRSAGCYELLDEIEQALFSKESKTDK